MPKCPPKSSIEPRSNPFIVKSISKSLLTPCRQVGLSRKRKTPNSLNKSTSNNRDDGQDDSTISMSNIALNDDSKDLTKVCNSSTDGVIVKPSPKPKEIKKPTNSRTPGLTKSRSKIATKVENLNKDEHVKEEESIIKVDNIAFNDESKDFTKVCNSSTDDIIVKPSPKPKEIKKLANIRTTGLTKSRSKIATKVETINKDEHVKEEESITKVDNKKKKVARCLLMETIPVKEEQKVKSSQVVETIANVCEGTKKEGSNRAKGRQNTKSKQVYCLDDDDDDDDDEISTVKFKSKMKSTKTNMAKPRKRILSDDDDDDFASNAKVNKKTNTTNDEILQKTENSRKIGHRHLNKHQSSDSEPSSQGSNFNVKLKVGSNTASANKRLRRILSDDEDDITPMASVTKINVPKMEQDHLYSLKSNFRGGNLKSIDSEPSSQDDNVPLLELKKPIKTYKRSLSMKKFSSNNDVKRSFDEPFKGFSTPIRQCSISLTPLRMSPDMNKSAAELITEDEDFLVKLKKVETLQVKVEEKRQLLEALKQAEIDKKMHNVDDINRTSARWKEGCKRALIDLLNNLKTRGEMTMPTLLKTLKVPPTLIRCNSDEDLE